jgi:hypothetical protein
VVSDVIRHSAGVHRFEETQTGYLMKVFSSLIDNSFHFFVFKSVRAKQLLQVVLTEGLEGAPVKLVLPGGRLVEYLVAAPGLVVLLLTLLTEHVADVVAVALLELVHVHLLSELLLPEGVGLVHGKTQPLDEETQLQAAVVLQMVFVAESRQ